VGACGIDKLPFCLGLIVWDKSGDKEDPSLAKVPLHAPLHLHDVHWVVRVLHQCFVDIRGIISPRPVCSLEANKVAAVDPESERAAGVVRQVQKGGDWVHKVLNCFHLPWEGIQIDINAYIVLLWGLIGV
jgi:hypothetical protein